MDEEGGFGLIAVAELGVLGHSPGSSVFTCLHKMPLLESKSNNPGHQEVLSALKYL